MSRLIDLSVPAAAMMLIVGSGVARGQDEPPPGAEGRHWADWSIKIEPMVWAPALRGDVELPRSSSVDLELLDADENEVIPAGRVTIRSDKWSFQFRGFGFSLDETADAGGAFNLGGNAVAPGDALRTEIDLAGFDLTAAYTVWTPIDDPANEVRLAFDLHAGARIHSVETEVAEVGGGSVRASDTWGEPIGGVNATLDLPHGLGLDLSLDAGGFATGDDSSFSWDITVAFSWRFIPNAGIEIGFRHLDMNLSEGDGADEFVFDAALAGLFGAIVIRF